jgi:two-component system, NtrC family, response regulator AtoC
MGDLLIVDDEETLAQSYARWFTRGGHAVRVAHTGDEALRAFRERRPDAILLDVNLPDMSGFDVFDALREDDPVVVMISGHAEVPMAVQAVQAGAETFLTKPVDLAQLGVVVDRALERGRLRELARRANARRAASGRLALGTSPAMVDLATQVELLAAVEHTPVLLIGEPGTGKGRLGGWIHATSTRRDGPWVEASCARAQATPLDAELFGREGDAGRAGLVEVASGGSLFLDEVGDLPLALQPRLLSLLESRLMRRVGGTREIPVDVRLIATTTHDLVTEVNTGRFREDLYYQLAVMPLRLPPLRERSRDDVAMLVDGIIAELAPALPHAPRQVSDAAMERLVAHSWPGNLRELRNILERAMLVSRGADVIGGDALPPDLARDAAGAAEPSPRPLEDVEREHIARALRYHADNRSHTARALGISRATLIKKIRHYGLGARPAPPSRGRIP